MTRYSLFYRYYVISVENHVMMNKIMLFHIDIVMLFQLQLIMLFNQRNKELSCGNNDIKNEYYHDIRIEDAIIRYQSMLLVMTTVCC